MVHVTAPVLQAVDFLLTPILHSLMTDLQTERLLTARRMRQVNPREQNRRAPYDASVRWITSP
jgi:hypothetical protein